MNPAGDDVRAQAAMETDQSGSQEFDRWFLKNAGLIGVLEKTLHISRICQKMLDNTLAFVRLNTGISIDYQAGERVGG